MTKDIHISQDSGNATITAQDSLKRDTIQTDTSSTEIENSKHNIQVFYILVLF
jgi:hypothetical protein